MLSLSDWMSRCRFPEKPWLMLGKGPTFACRRDYDLSRYNLVSLNHAVREQPVQWAHMIDVDVASECADSLLANAEYLVMPKHPHVQFRPSPRRLDEFVAEVPILAEFERRGRLVWYNLRSWKQPEEGSPVVHAKFFSSEAALDILGLMGATDVRSLGVDGGRGYSTTFQDLEGKTMLANGHESFDIQFAELDALAAKHRLAYAPLVEPLRVFVGVDEAHLVAARVLDYSIRKHCTRPVVLSPMLNLAHPVPSDPGNRPRTPFSFYRFMIPRLRRGRGTALYLDPHMLVFGDIAELWEIPFEQHAVLCSRQTATEAWRRPDWGTLPRNTGMMLLDCARLDWDVADFVRRMDAGEMTYPQLMGQLSVVPSDAVADKLPAEWNSVEAYEPGRTKAVNFNVAATKPWRSDANALGHLWDEACAEAVAAGFVGPDLLKAGAERGYLKPSLVATC